MRRSLLPIDVINAYGFKQKRVRFHLKSDVIRFAALTREM